MTHPERLSYPGLHFRVIRRPVEQPFDLSGDPDVIQDFDIEYSTVAPKQSDYLLHHNINAADMIEDMLPSLGGLYFEVGGVRVRTHYPTGGSPQYFVEARGMLNDNPQIVRDVDRMHSAVGDVSPSSYPAIFAVAKTYDFSHAKELQRDLRIELPTFEFAAAEIINV